jgi:hypothetical protein
MATMTRLTEARARTAGYCIVRGAYLGTTDDRADRWYVDHTDEEYLDHRGDGFVTKAAALLAIERKLDTDAHSAWLDTATCDYAVQPPTVQGGISFDAALCGERGVERQYGSPVRARVLCEEHARALGAGIYGVTLPPANRWIMGE